jgi:hypothetical protein
MQKDTFGFLVVAILVIPFGFGLWLGLRTDFARVCISDTECGEGVCLEGSCFLPQRCGWARQGQVECDRGGTCDMQKGRCYQERYRYSGWIRLHPDYASYRAEHRARQANGLMFQRNGRRAVQYRARGGGGFRGGGLGFGK